MTRLAAAMALAGVVTGSVAMRANLPPAVKRQARTSEAALAEVLRRPLPVSDLALKVAAYTLEDADPSKIRLLLACEIDRTSNPAGGIALAYAVADAKGTIVANHFEPQVKAPVRANRTQLYIGSAVAVPETYTVTVAVLDDAGKRGRLERIFKAQLTTAGSIRSSDLLIGDRAAGEGGLTPSASSEIAGDTLQGYLELSSDAADALKSVAAEIEVAPTAEGRTLERSWLRFAESSGTKANRRTGEGSVLIAFLAPGSYVARAAITADGKRLGQVTRPFRIVRGTKTTAAATPAAAPAAAAPKPVAARPGAFERASVLTPQVLSFVVDKMNAGRRAGATPPAALDAARAAQFDAAVEAAGTSRLAALFIGGLSLFAKGELEDAANKFRETLRLDSEFFPAAFYLGACYAAGGKDREATAAWSTSLVTLNDAPFVYTQLGDAYLRLRETESAVDILREAAGQWPDNEGLRVQLANALAAAGKAAEAIDILDRHIAKHPDDHRAILMALGAIHLARSAGKGIGTPVEDRERFARYAAAYAAAGGPEQALVDEWKKIFDK